MMKRSCLTLACLVLLLVWVEGAKAGTIETTSKWDGIQNMYQFGNPDSTTYGQTITATATNNVLQSFTFYLAPYEGSPPTFQAYVSSWDTTELTGPLLYTSAITMGPSSGGAYFGGYTAYTFNTGGVNLTVGDQYALFISVAGANYSANQNETDHLGAVSQSAYMKGSFIYSNNIGEFDQLYSGEWVTNTNINLAFTANFGDSAAPEPASLTMLGIGTLGLLGYAWRRCKTAALPVAN